jgi:hypothetical protein
MPHVRRAWWFGTAESAQVAVDFVALQRRSPSLMGDSHELA